MLKEIGGKTADWAIKNAPTILIAIGSAGVVLTAVATGKASIKAKKALDEMPEDADIKEKAKVVAPIMAKPFLLGAATIFCILYANHQHLKREAAIAAAYTLSSRALEEYEGKVIETLGKAKDKKIRDAIAEDKVNENPPTPEFLENDEPEKIICYDTWSGRYFRVIPENIDRAVNIVNSVMNSEGFASLNEWYDAVGLSGVENGEELGWKLSEDGLLELEPDRYQTSVLYQNKYPVRVLKFNVKPKEYFDYYY